MAAPVAESEVAGGLVGQDEGGVGHEGPGDGGALHLAPGQPRPGGEPPGGPRRPGRAPRGPGLGVPDAVEQQGQGHPFSAHVRWGSGEELEDEALPPVARPRSGSAEARGPRGARPGRRGPPGGSPPGRAVRGRDAAHRHRPGPRGPPASVLADEPTGNLDSATGAAILDLLAAQVAETGAAMLMVTHDAAAAARADRVVSLRDGRLA